MKQTGTKFTRFGAKLAVRVIPGKGRGRKIGIPTFNFSVSPSLVAPQGIYAGWLWVGGKRYPVAIHWGPRPVFSEEVSMLEAHVLGKTLPPVFKRGELELISWIRPVQNFPTPGAMVAQIQKDIAQAQKLLGR